MTSQRVEVLQRRIIVNVDLALARRDKEKVVGLVPRNLIDFHAVFFRVENRIGPCVDKADRVILATIGEQHDKIESELPFSFPLTLSPTAICCPFGLQQMLMFSPPVLTVPVHLPAAQQQKRKKKVSSVEGRHRWIFTALIP